MHNLDEKRINDGSVSPEEMKELELRLVGLYIERAKESNKDIQCVDLNSELYKKIIASGEIIDGDKYYLVTDEEGIVDLRNVAYALLDTEEGLFYAKAMQQEGHL